MRPLYLFLKVVILAFLSCNGSEDIHKRMEQIKRTGNDEPMLALRMLDSLSTSVRDMSEETAMKYYLLKLRLQDKAYMEASSDLTVKKLLRYYEKEGTATEKQEIYYYAGSVYRDLQDTPRAIEYFLKSTEVATKNEHCDSVMQKNAYSNLFYLFFHVQDYRNAYKYSLKEYEQIRKSGTTDIIALTHLGDAYRSLDSLEQARKLFIMGLDVVSKSLSLQNDLETICNLLLELSYLNDTLNANRCYAFLINKSDECKKNQRQITFDENNGKNYALAHYYKLMNKKDSIIYYNQQILQDGTDPFRTYDASKMLFHIYHSEGNMSEAAKYADLYIRISDSIDLGKRQEMAASVNNAFQYHLDKNEEQRVMEENNRFRFLLAISCMAGVIILFITCIIIIYKRNRHLKDMLTISNERNRLMNQNRTFLNMLHQSELENKAEDVIKAIRQASEGKKNMQSTDWKQLYQAVDELYPDFKDQLLKELGSFTEQQMQVCYLMRIGLSKPQIQHMTNMSRATVWRWVKKYDWITNH